MSTKRSDLAADRVGYACLGAFLLTALGASTLAAPTPHLAGTA